jgi:hypothetical protein
MSQVQGLVLCEFLMLVIASVVSVTLFGQLDCASSAESALHIVFL